MRIQHLPRVGVSQDELVLYEEGAAIDVPIGSLVVGEVETQVALRMEYFFAEEVELVQKKDEGGFAEERVVDDLAEEVQALFQTVHAWVLLKLDYNHVYRNYKI